MTLGLKRKKLQCSCSGCLSKDCGCCKFCLDMPRFGGPGKKKKRCIQRKCTGSSGGVLSDITNSSQVKRPTLSESKVQLILQCYIAITVPFAFTEQGSTCS